MKYYSSKSPGSVGFNRGGGLFADCLTIGGVNSTSFALNRHNMSVRKGSLFKASVLTFVATTIPLGLLIESALVSAMLIILIGIPIRWAERQANQPYFSSFGTLFWAGHVLTRVVAAFVRMWLSSVQLSPLALQSTLVGIASFACAYIAFLLRAESSDKPWLDRAQVNVNWPRALWVSGIVALVSTVLVSAVGGQPRMAPDQFGLAYNVISGIQRSIYLLPAVLLGLSVLQRTWRHRLLIGLFCSTIFIGDVLGSGRGIFLNIVITSILTWSLFQRHFKKIFISILVFLVVSCAFIIILASYRSEYYAPYLGATYRAKLLVRTVSEFDLSGYYLRGQVLRAANRLYEPPSIDLMHLSESKRFGDGWYALDQLLFLYFPKALFPDKGSGRTKDVLVTHGIIRYQEGSGIPIVLVADAYYRWGMPGVIAVYSLTGAVLALLTSWFWRMHNPVLVSVFMSIVGVTALRGYVKDVYGLIVWWLDDIPKLFVFSIPLLIAIEAVSLDEVRSWLAKIRQ